MGIPLFEASLVLILSMSFNIFANYVSAPTQGLSLGHSLSTMGRGTKVNYKLAPKIFPQLHVTAILNPSPELQSEDSDYVDLPAMQIGLNASVEIITPFGDILVFSWYLPLYHLVLKLYLILLLENG